MELVSSPQTRRRGSILTGTVDGISFFPRARLATITRHDRLTRSDLAGVLSIQEGLAGPGASQTYCLRHRHVSFFARSSSASRLERCQCAIIEKQRVEPENRRDFALKPTLTARI
jgi:hypothetical protein